ncbi:hypothetical protein ZYGR_0AS02440 [Zygosaccharomyces rouxii]|uniref:ditrans,polycis-polyprenyl diphosphate synthase [(2E,6E)-farnesyldiphosphate specific] n=1 Tax=Zygosaccharomyces rouxii TaxID=4956 RepID=A0A1Q3AGW7_ZYGRO|nr:hypothetical protein ZYGR_0AS02440 [Zygosaccharomyces rouxii]
MSSEKIAENARLLAGEDVDVSSNRVPPPEANFMKDPSKLKAFQAVTYSAAANEGQTTRTPKNNAFWNQEMGKIQYFISKTLLVGMYLVFGLFRYLQYECNKMKLRIWNVIYNPSNTPQLIRQDVTKLDKIPRRLAAILEMKSVGSVGGGVKGLMNDGSEVACWTVSAGIKHLILYDFDGILKKNVLEFKEEIKEKLSRYFGPSNVPKFALRIPHKNKVHFSNDDSHKVSLEISLLSNRDGRQTIVDLTKTMAELTKSKELQLQDITMRLMDKELTQLVGPEPDLLLYFGPSLDLQGFPPWHLRLTEFHWEQDNDQVAYSIFIRGLHKYSNCKINVGK